MKWNKKFFMGAMGIMGWILVQTLAWPKVAPETEKDFFSTQGVITRVNVDEKILHVKIEGGLELTFYTNEATLIKAGEEAKAFTDLAVDDRVEIEYVYNEDYKKVARLIKITKVSSEKIQEPSMAPLIP